MKQSKNEKYCIKYALRFRKDLRLSSKIRMSYFNNETSETKSFEQFWSDFGLRDYGQDFWNRGQFNKEQKLNCLQAWVDNLYIEKIIISDLYKEIEKEMLIQLDKFMKENPGVRINMSKVENVIPERIDLKYGNYINKY
jgi:hypothetical protein